MSGHLALIVCGAPLAARTPGIAAATVAKGWSVAVIATRAALPWLDEAAIAAVTGAGPRTEYRTPEEPKRGPRPDAVVVCPMTFNTLNKAALGLADSYAMGVLCEAIGARTPVAVFPMINDGLWGHPAVAGSLATLRGAGVGCYDVHTGQPGEYPVRSGTGLVLTERFDPAWALDLLG